MNEKVTLPKEVADYIAELKNDDQDVGVIYAYTMGRWSLRPAAIMSALVNGYQVEQTPEENLNKYYKSYEICKPELADRYVGIREGVRQTLDILGIKIAGINA